MKKAVRNKMMDPMRLSCRPVSSSSSSGSVFYNVVVLSILITETAERVAYFGFRAVLVLYFTGGLQFSESTSVSLCAATVALAYLSPLVGAALADSTWGRFRTIWRFGAVYAVGLCLLTLAAFQVETSPDATEAMMRDENDDDNDDNALGINKNGDPPVVSNANLAWERLLSFAGLFLICIGTGGIKPCVSAFGADQVVLIDEPSSLSSPSSQDGIPTMTSTSDSSKREFQTSHSQYRDDDQDTAAGRCTSHGEENHEVRGSSNDDPAGGHHHQQERIREFFNSFYFCINVGALASFAIIPLVRANYGFGAAFFVPTLCMIFALGVFMSQRTAYKHRIPDPTHQPSLSRVVRISFRILVENGQFSCCPPRSRRNRRSSIDAINLGGHVLLPTTLEEGEGVASPLEQSSAEMAASDQQFYDDACQVLHLMPLMLFFPIFWMLYDQQGSVWTLQATRLNLYGLEPEQLQFLNPLEIMLFIPLFDQIIYPWLERHGFNIEPLRRMEYGMFLAAVSFCCSALLESVVQNRPFNSVSLAWQIPQITILTVAEILLNVTGLEFAYSQAPSNMQAIILATFLFMTAIGDGLGALLFATVFANLNSVVSMTICAVCMLINMVFFSRVARRWKPYQKSHGHHDVDSDDVVDDDYGLEMRKIPQR